MLFPPDLLYGNLRSKQGKLVMLNSFCSLFSLLFVASLASAEVFKCLGKNGEALYQNFPCQFESVSGMPMDVQDQKKSVEKSPEDAPVPKKSPTVPTEPRVGMTTDEVRATRAEPTEIVQEETGDGDRFQASSYGASRAGPRERKSAVHAKQTEILTTQ